MSLRAAVMAAGPEIMGTDYAARHEGLGRLAKLFDYVDRIAFHYHQQRDDAALVGSRPKEEAYYFPQGVDLGAHPETYFGVHPYIVEHGLQEELLLPHLVHWQDDLILRHSRAFLQVPGEGWHVPAGVPHAPGTALTLELQEDSDVFAVLQAQAGGEMVPKDLLWKDVLPEDREQHGERLILEQINWAASGDPYFYENRRLAPVPVAPHPALSGPAEGPGGNAPQQNAAQQHAPTSHEQWILYNTPKFSGKRLAVAPGASYATFERGVYSLLVWQGQGVYDGHQFEAGCFGRDELLVAHARSIEPLVVNNLGAEDLVILKFFGPDINPDAPVIAPYP
jgi:hypothetical protein